jgi:hypothetical protein
MAAKELQAAQERFSELRRQEYQLSQKIAELENERHEHEYAFGFWLLSWPRSHALSLGA